MGGKLPVCVDGCMCGCGQAWHACVCVHACTITHIADHSQRFINCLVFRVSSRPASRSSLHTDNTPLPPIQQSEHETESINKQLPPPTPPPLPPSLKKKKAKSSHTVTEKVKKVGLEEIFILCTFSEAFGSESF